jgi:hypothetical protein
MAALGSTGGGAGFRAIIGAGVDTGVDTGEGFADSELSSVAEDRAEEGGRGLLLSIVDRRASRAARACSEIFSCFARSKALQKAATVPKNVSTVMFESSPAQHGYYVHEYI